MGGGREWRTHVSPTLPTDLLHLFVKSIDIEVAILIAFMLSENAQSCWVVSMILHDPASSYILSFNSLYSSIWFHIAAILNYSGFLIMLSVYRIYAIVHAVFSVTDPSFAFICWAMLTDFKRVSSSSFESTLSSLSWVQGFFYHNHFLLWSSLNLFISWLSFIMKCEILHVMSTVTRIFPKLSTLQLWIIIKQKDSNRNLIDINMYPLVLLVAPWRKLFFF